MNEEAYAQLRCEKRFEIVPRATHLFEEPGAPEEVVRLARNWFTRHLASGKRRERQAASAPGRVTLAAR